MKLKSRGSVASPKFAGTTGQDLKIHIDKANAEKIESGELLTSDKMRVLVTRSLKNQRRKMNKHLAGVRNEIQDLCRL